MASGHYAPLATSSEDSIDHQYRDDQLDGRSQDSFDRRQASWQYSAQREVGLVEKGKRQYWAGKQYVREKMGKEQDQFQMADDAELDSQMERARHIQKQCLALCRALLRYQEIVQLLTSRQVALSSLLRAYAESEPDGPCAEMMSRLGNVMQDEAVSRLELDVPLTRFFSEIETFRCRALVDTLINISQVTLERRKFRGALLWMADASRNLDPDTRKQLTKFRQAQQMAREARQEFEGKKGVVCEKVDLLGASFCNLLSHAMTPYQRVLGQQWSKSSEQYQQLLAWSRETLRHQYRLQRDVLRDRDRQQTGDGEEARDESQPTKGHTSESWSENRMLSVIGEPILAPAAESAQDALEAEQQEQPDSRSALEMSAKEALEPTPPTVPDTAAGLTSSVPRASQQPSSARTVDAADSKPDYSWLDLMTEGSAAAALADFDSGAPGGSSAPQQSQIQQALLDLARNSTGGDFAAQRLASEPNEDILSYEMSAGEQRLQGVNGMRQLTNDEGQLDQLVPMNSNLRMRQEQDMRMETQLEQELAQMVSDFSSLATMPSPFAADITESSQDPALPPRPPLNALPGDLLDIGAHGSSPANLFLAGRSPFSQPPAGMASSQHAGLSSMAAAQGAPNPAKESAPSTAAGSGPGAQQRAKASTESSKRQKWFDLFSELDPLANPDDLRFDQDGEKPGDTTTEKLAL